MPLTAREREICTLAAAGVSSPEIAEKLYLSVRTVNNHLQRAYTKLGVTNRRELASALDVVTRNARASDHVQCGGTPGRAPPYPGVLLSVTGSTATADPATLTSPFSLASSTSRSTRFSPLSLRFPVTAIFDVSFSPGHVCLVNRTLKLREVADARPSR